MWLGRMVGCAVCFGEVKHYVVREDGRMWGMLRGGLV